MSGSCIAAATDAGVAVQWSDDIAARVLDLYAHGEPFYKIARREGFPNSRTLFEWRERHPDWALALAHARSARAEVLVEEGLTTLDGCDGDSASQVTKAREQGAYRRWLAGCLDRDTYGDRTQVALSGTIGTLVAFVGSTPRVEDARVMDAIPHAVVPDGAKDAPGA